VASAADGVREPHAVGTGGEVDGLPEVAHSLSLDTRRIPYKARPRPRRVPPNLLIENPLVQERSGADPEVKEHRGVRRALPAPCRRGGRSARRAAGRTGATSPTRGRRDV
jgi:hypothetical protein